MQEFSRKIEKIIKSIEEKTKKLQNIQKNVKKCDIKNI